MAGKPRSALKDSGEVVALIGKQFRERLFPVLDIGREDHLAHRVDAIAFEEHVLGAGETDADGPKSEGVLGLFGVVGVAADIEARGLRAPVHKLVERLELLGFLRGFVPVQHAGDDLAWRGGELAGVNSPGRSIDGKKIAFLERLPVHGNGLLPVIDLQRRGAADANLAHLARDERGVRRDAAFRGENSFCRDHAAQIFRTRFVAHEKNLFALLRGSGRTIRIQINLPGRSAGTSGKTARDSSRLLRLGDIKDRREKLVQLVRRIAHYGRLPIDELLLEHVHGELEGGGGGPFAVAGLQHEKLAILDGELDVLHILEMLLERSADPEQFRVAFGHQLLQLEDRLRCAHASHDVFSLGIDQKLAVEFVHAVGRVASEGDAGSGVRAGIAIDHGLHVDRRAPILGNVVFPAIDDRAIVHPGAEHRARGAFELVPWVIGKGLTGAFFHQLLKADDQLLVIGGLEFRIVDIVLAVFLVFVVLDDGFERIVIFAFAFLHAHDHVAIHLDETAVAIPRESLVLRRLDQRLHRLVVQAEI